MNRLGVVLSTATEAPSKEFVELGKLAEDKGYTAILVNEGRGDALACTERSRSGHHVSKSARTSPTFISAIHFLPQ